MLSRAQTQAVPGTRLHSRISDAARDAGVDVARPIAALAAAAIVALSGCGSGNRSANPRLLERPDLQRTLGGLTRARRSAALALVVTKAGIWRGAADSGRRRHAAAQKRFGIASTTKTFVATVVLQLAADGRLSLDDRVERWLPGLLPDGRTITVRQLLNHSSGLPNDVSSGLPPRERAALAARQGSYARPGTAFAYSNIITSSSGS